MTVSLRSLVSIGCLLLSLGLPSLARAEKTSPTTSTKARTPAPRATKTPPTAAQQPGKVRQPADVRKATAALARPRIPRRIPLRRPQRYRIELATIGQGNYVFTYFGHNALIVYDRFRYGRATTYNFGTFNGGKPLKLLKDYVNFTMKYWLSTPSLRYMKIHYKRNDRAFETRELYLTPKEAKTLVAWLRNHARRENREYSYHHYTSNCSTKLRDALKAALGERFRGKASIKRGWTYRKHVMANTNPNPVLKWLMDFGTGPYGDKPLTWWEDMFLPDHLEAYISAPFWRTLRGRPLASKPHIVYKRQRGPSWTWSSRRITLFLTLFLVLLGGLLTSPIRFRQWLRTVMLFFGVLGSVLFFMMFFTKMPEPPKNANLLLYHPGHFYLWWLLSKKRWYFPQNQQIMRRYLAIHALLGVLYLLVRSTGIVPYQANNHFIWMGIGVFGFASFQLWRMSPHDFAQNQTTAEEQTAEDQKDNDEEGRKERAESAPETTAPSTS